MAAIDAQGAVISIDTAATPGTVDTPIENVKSFSGFDGEASEIDTTDLSSTAKEYRLGLQDFGNFSMDVNFDANASAVGQAECKLAAKTRREVQFEVTFFDTSKAEFAGFIKNADAVSGAVDGVLEGSISVRITGEVTFTDAV